MPRYSAKQRKMRGGRSGKPPFVQLPHYIKRSAAYHGLSVYARALLIELIYRHTGINNGLICFGVREAEHELRCGHATVCRAMRDLDDAGLARPTGGGVWRGRHATEWRLMWIRCEKTGDLPVKQWTERKAYEPKQPPTRKPLSDAERAKRYRSRKRDRHENRHDEVRWGTAEGPLENRERDVRSATEPQKRKSSMDASRPRSATGAHIDIYQGQGNGRTAT